MTDPNPLKQAAEEAKARKLAEVVASKTAQEREKLETLREHARISLEPLGFEVSDIRPFSIRELRSSMLRALGIPENHATAIAGGLGHHRAQERHMVYLTSLTPIELSPNELDDALRRAGYRFADLDEVLASLLQNADAVPSSRSMAAFGSIYTKNGSVYSTMVENPHSAKSIYVGGYVKGQPLQNAGLITIPVVRLVTP